MSDTSQVQSPPASRENKRKSYPKKDTASSRKKKQKVCEKVSSTLSDSVIDIDETWISASKTRNYMLKDPLLDWLAMYGESKGFVSDSKNETDLQKSLNFGKFIMTKGIEFESYIVSLMKKDHGENFHEVDGSDSIDKKSKINRQIKDTLNFMRRGSKIIYQGIVYNPVNKTWGYPDLIVRSDYLNELCEHGVISEEKSKKGCIFSDEWHYRIVDIKFATLKMKADGKSLLNGGSIPPYKAQTCIYNRALGYMQNLVPRKAYLMGRGWNTSKTSVSKPFDKLGTVDFGGDDLEIEEDVSSAIEWIRNLRECGSKWNILPSPSVPQLYPNMCNDSNNDWGSAKKLISNTLHEITSLWQCGVSDREIAHSKGVYKWSDPKCSAEVMNKGGKVNPPMINRIIDINRGDGDKIFSIEEKTKSDGWRRNDDIPSFFIDFETVSNINNVRASDEDGNIFMIGSVFEDEFSCFVSSRLTFRDEKKVLEDFLKYVSDICKSRNKTECRFYHYSFAEPSCFKKALRKYNIVQPIDLHIEWTDLLRVVKEMKFVVKGSMNFSLKSLVEASYNNKIIDMSYGDSDIGNGLSAMVAAFVADDIAMKRCIPMWATDLMKSVISYNKIDCMVLQKFRDLLEKISQ